MLRSGTENTAGIVAMAKALRLKKNAQQRIENMIEIRNYLIRTIKTYNPNIITHTPSENAAPHIVQFFHMWSSR